MTVGSSVQGEPVAERRQPVQVRGEVLARRRVGAYHLVEIAAGGIAERFRPGQFVALSVGGPASALLLRRSFAVYRATPVGAYSGTVQIVVPDAPGPLVLDLVCRVGDDEVHNRYEATIAR